jgi:hypothetical protein
MYPRVTGTLTPISTHPNANLFVGTFSLCKLKSACFSKSISLPSYLVNISIVLFFCNVFTLQIGTQLISCLTLIREAYMMIQKGWLCRKFTNWGCAFSGRPTRFWCLFGGSRGGSKQCFQLTVFLPLLKRKMLKTLRNMYIGSNET